MEAPEKPDVSVPVGDYRSARVLSLGATRWVVIQLLLTAVVMVVDVHEWNILEANRPDLVRADSIDRLNGTLSLILLASYLISAALVIAWLFRAYGQLRPLGIREPRFKRGWAIGGWFVPFLNLGRPLQVVNDVWRSGDVDDPSPAWQWRERTTSSLLGWWWAGWLLTSFLGNLSFRAGVRDDTLEQISDGLALDAVAQAVSIPAGILLILVVRRATARQDERAAQLAAQPG